MTQRINITIADNLAEQAKQFAKDNGITFSALVASCLIRTLNERQVADALVGVGESFKLICQRPDIDTETLEQLNAYSKMLEAYSTSVK